MQLWGPTGFACSIGDLRGWSGLSRFWLQGDIQVIELGFVHSSWEIFAALITSILTVSISQLQKKKKIPYLDKLHANAKQRYLDKLKTINNIDPYDLAARDPKALPPHNRTLWTILFLHKLCVLQPEFNQHWITVRCMFCLWTPVLSFLFIPCFLPVFRSCLLGFLGFWLCPLSLWLLNGILITCTSCTCTSVPY